MMRIEIEPVGRVEASRAEAEDDFWGGETACITLADRFDAESLAGLEPYRCRTRCVCGTPVVDIKPVMQEFLPREAVRQPAWSRELMASYWSRK